MSKTISILFITSIVILSSFTAKEGKFEHVIYDNTKCYCKNFHFNNNSGFSMTLFKSKEHAPQITIKLTKKNEIQLNKNIVSKEDMIKELRLFLLKNGANHIIKFENHKQTSYGFYCEIQNCIFNVYSDLKNEKAKEIYDRTYEELNNTEKYKIDSYYPKNITE
jgi:hypothetical protein